MQVPVKNYFDKNLPSTSDRAIPHPRNAEIWCLRDGVLTNVFTYKEYNYNSGNHYVSKRSYGETIAAAVSNGHNLAGLSLHPDQVNSAYRHEMSNNNYNGAKMANAQFWSMDFTGTKLDKAVLDGAVFRNCSGVDLSLNGSSARDAVFINCKFKNINLANTDLTGARFINCEIDTPTLHETKLIKAHLFNTHFKLSNNKAGNNSYSADLNNSFWALCTLISNDSSPLPMRFKVPETAFAGCAFYGFEINPGNERFCKPDFSALEFNDTRLNEEERAFVTKFGQWLNRSDCPDYLKIRPENMPKMDDQRIYTVLSDMKLGDTHNQTDNVLITCLNQMVVRTGYNNCIIGGITEFFPKLFTEEGLAERKEKAEAERAAKAEAEKIAAAEKAERDRIAKEERIAKEKREREEWDERQRLQRIRDEEAKRVAAEKKKADEAAAAEKKRQEEAAAKLAAEEEERRNRTALVIVKPADIKNHKVPEITFDAEWMNKEMAQLADARMSDAMNIGSGLQRIFADASGIIAQRAVATLGRQSQLEEVVTRLNDALKSGNLDDVVAVANKVNATAKKSGGWFGSLFGSNEDDSKVIEHTPQQPQRTPFETISEMHTQLPKIIEAERIENSKNLDDFENARKFLIALGQAFDIYAKRLNKEQETLAKTNPDIVDIIKDRVRSLEGSLSIIGYLSASVEMYIQSTVKAGSGIQWLQGSTIPLIHTHFAKMASLHQLAQTIKTAKNAQAIDQLVISHYKDVIDPKSKVPLIEQVRRAFTDTAEQMRLALEEPSSSLLSAQEGRTKALTQILSPNAKKALAGPAKA